MKHDLDTILEGLRKSELDEGRLRHLKSDVWLRIAEMEADQPVGALERLLSAFFSAHHRLTPVMCAGMLGIFVGLGSMWPVRPTPDAAEMLNLKVFEPSMIALASITPINEGL